MRLFFLLLLTAAVALGYAALNQTAIHAANPVSIYVNSSSLRVNILVNSVEDECYLNPVEIFLVGNRWHRDLLGRSGYARRTPGYSLWYLPFRVLPVPRPWCWALGLPPILLLAFLRFAINTYKYYYYVMYNTCRYLFLASCLAAHSGQTDSLLFCYLRCLIKFSWTLPFSVLSFPPITGLTLSVLSSIRFDSKCFLTLKYW